MNTEFFISKRLIRTQEGKKTATKSILGICVAAIALSIAVTITAVAVVTGFKKNITDKVVGFGSHIHLINFDSNRSFETIPIKKDSTVIRKVSEVKNVDHIQYFATKPGIIKANDNIQGIVLKGIDKNFKWDFFQKTIKKGDIFHVTDTATSNSVIISEYVSNLLELNVGDRFATYFIQDPPRMRVFTISGIYETGMQIFDEYYVLADIKHIQKLNNWTENQISGIEVLTNNLNGISVTSERIERRVGNIFYEDGSKLYIENILEKYPYIFDWLGLMDTNAVVIILLVIIVASINMISGLIILILERTNFIGILKALGFPNRSVRRIFLYNAFYLILKGLIIGNVLGLGICWLQKHFKIIHLDQASYYLDTVPVNLNALHISLVNIVAAVAIFLSLLIPSLIISKISPSRAIRFE